MAFPAWLELRGLAAAGAATGIGTPGKLDSRGVGGALSAGLEFRVFEYASVRLGLDMSFLPYRVMIGSAMNPQGLDSVLNCFSFPLIAKAVLPMGRLRAFAGLGIDGSVEWLAVTAISIGSMIPSSATTTAIGWEYEGGFEVRLSNRFNLGAEYRREYLSADFGVLTGGSVDTGGHLVLVRLSY